MSWAANSPCIIYLQSHYQPLRWCAVLAKNIENNGNVTAHPPLRLHILAKIAHSLYRVKFGCFIFLDATALGLAQIINMRDTGLFETDWIVISSEEATGQTDCVCLFSVML